MSLISLIPGPEVESSSGSFSWRALGADPFFLLQWPPGEGLQPGWYRWQLTLEGDLTEGRAKLYFDFGEGFNEGDTACLPFVTDKAAWRWVWLSRVPVTVRFDPCEVKAAFAVKHLRLEAVAADKASASVRACVQRELGRWSLDDFDLHAVYAFYDEALRLHQAVSAGDEIPCRVLPDAATTARALAALRPSAGVLRRQRAAVNEWPVRPLLSVIIPCFNSRPEWLAALLQSVLDQSYPIWECVLVDDASSVRAHVPVVAHFVAEDERFRWVQSEVNVGPGGASAIGVEEARGDYFAVVDHDDVLEPNALYEVACVIRAVQPAVVYSDEVLVDEFGAVLRAEFRPDFDYALLLSHPYIVHLTFVRRALALAVGNFRRDWPICQDYDLLLRVAAKSRDFVHVPKVLYRWRTHGGSTGHRLRARVNRLSVQALDGHLEQVGVSAAEGWAEPGLSFNFFRLRRRIAPCQVRVIIPTRDRVDLLQTCLSSLASQTVLPVGVRWGLTVVDNGSVESASLRYLKAVRAAGNRVLPMPGAFNFSALNNAAAARCEADFLLFLNNDIEVIEPGWLEAMLELMAWPDVGVVGAKLLYPETGLIQHAGVVVGFNGTAAHDHQFYPEKLGEGDGAHWAPGHGHGLLTIRECSAVTAACMLVRRSAFDEVGGFDEQLAVGFGDTDLCLRLKQRGWRTLFTPYARLIHHESASRGVSEEDSHPDDTALFKRRWSRFMRSGDPFYNRNLALTGVPYWPKEAG